MDPDRDRMFPALAKTSKVSPQLLQLLRHIDISKQSQTATKRWTQIEEMTLRSLPEQAERALGPDHPELAKLLHRLAVIYHSRDDLDRAEPLYRRALDIAKRALSKSNPEAALIMNNLGRVLYAKGTLTEAGQFYQAALELLEKSLGADHPRLATPLSNVARLHLDQGNLSLASKYYASSLKILTEALGPLHPKVIKIAKKLESVNRQLSPSASFSPQGT